MIKNFRDSLAIIYVVTLVLWLALVCFFLLPLVISSPGNIDPMMALVAGLGIGGVTQFFIVIGTIIYQFYFRKANTEETP